MMIQMMMNVNFCSIIFGNSIVRFQAKIVGFFLLERIMLCVAHMNDLPCNLP